MPKRTHAQRDFSGGEISTRMLMRAETPVYQKSVLEMENFQPTLQGGAERSPGTRFAYDVNVPSNNARILSYLTPANQSGFVEITVGSIKLKTALIGLLGAGEGVVGDPGGTGMVTVRKQIVANSNLKRGADGWTMEPEAYPAAEGDILGLEWSAFLGGIIRGPARVWRNGDTDTCTITTTAVVDEATTNVTIAFFLEYLENFSSPEAEYEATVKVGRSAGASDVLNYIFEGPVGTVKDLVLNRSLDGGAPWTGTLHIQVQWRALSSPQEPHSTPCFRFRGLQIWADGVVDITEDSIQGTPPYALNELDDLHYIQSPYSSPAASPEAPAKQLVVVHPNHPPYQLYFNSDPTATHPDLGLLAVGYVFARIIFVNPPAWSVNNYPCTCTSFNGRLILAGAQDQPDLGAPTSPNTETVWGTEVGDWQRFSTEEQVDPDDSIEFATIYRSPIQWVYGQKQLLVGALEMEYSASADGIFQPADIGTEMHSTHGSNRVQPVGIGKSVLFPADGGIKVRELMFQNEDQGWVAPDLTLLHPELCSSGIRRMVRMRNPHQMAIVLLNSGQLAVLHHDAQAGLFGWSRMNLTKGTKIIDMCTCRNLEGEDLLFLLVRRNVQGSTKLYVESIPNWVENSTWEYVTSGTEYIPETPISTLGGLSHIEGKQVQVVADGDYLGTYVVTGGQVDLQDQAGNTIEVNSALVGLPMIARMTLLPPAAEDPGSAKSYDAVSVRIRNSTRPIINGVRPGDRSPVRIMGKSEKLEEFEDVSVSDLQWTLYESVTIEENVPLRCEILGVYGELSENQL